MSLIDTQLMIQKTKTCYAGLSFSPLLPYASRYLCSLVYSLIISIVIFAYSFQAIPISLHPVSSFTLFKVCSTYRFFIEMNSYAAFSYVLTIDVLLSAFQYSYWDSFSTNFCLNTSPNRIACSESST